ncbi:cytochrome c3 family protein [Dasania marina]|uniref:cytochrome c3 family protein n=1 Tax=Dasania marina TaxID=471499 RepID=UPI000381EB4B|nr:cytochrome c3 family protein [Dasania marina]
MEFLLREITSEQGVVVYQDTELAAELITIGSAAAQLIQLRGSAIKHSHAVLKLVAGQITIQAVGKHTLVVNGSEYQSRALSVGDEIVISSHKLKIIEPPAGFDAACELYIDDELQKQALESAYVTDLASTVLAKRAPAYLLSLIVVLLALAWPISAYLLRDNGADATAEQTFIKSGSGDHLWSTGPLLPAHQLEIGNDCSACHKKAFQTVQNESCVTCHQDTADHINSDALTVHGDEATQNIATSHKAYGVSECQSCHKEHNEPAALVVKADALCVDCHRQAQQLSDNSKGTPAISGFDTGSHPAFKLNYVLPEVLKKGTGISITWDSHLLEKAAGQADISNLKFPHDIHLDAGKVQLSDTGEAMSCNSCHALKADKEHFAAITMEKHCSSCHDLSFDANEPDRQLPHGEPSLVVQTIEEHFVRVYTDPNYKAPGSDRRRRPGKSASQSACSDKPFNCGMQRATTEAAIQFTQRGCVTCHEVSDNQSDDMYARWLVMPVNINDNWHARALFDHASHLTKQGQSKDQTCLSCHEADQSASSADVLIPGIDNCLSCHGDVSIAEKVPVNCISCHAYHPKDVFTQ